MPNTSRRGRTLLPRGGEGVKALSGYAEWFWLMAVNIDELIEKVER